MTKCERNGKKRHTTLVKTGKWHYNRRCGAAEAVVYEWCEHSYVSRGVLPAPRGCRIYYFWVLLYNAQLEIARGKRKKGKSVFEWKILGFLPGIYRAPFFSRRRLIIVPLSSAPMIKVMALIFSQISSAIRVPMEPYSRE